MLNKNYRVPGNRPIIAIVCKYNSQKVLSFIVTEDTRITKAGIPLLSNYPEHFSNFSIRTVAYTLVMSKFFGYVNEVDSHNKSRQYDLALESSGLLSVVGYS